MNYRAMNTDEVKERCADICMQFGDGETEFSTRDVNHLLSQLHVEESNNAMLVQELEELKQRDEIVCEQRNRLQNNLINQEEVNAELRQTIIALQQRHIKLENMLADHQELSQWIEEQIDNEPDTMIFEVSHDFLEILYDKVHKINH